MSYNNTGIPCQQPVRNRVRVAADARPAFQAHTHRCRCRIRWHTGCCPAKIETPREMNMTRTTRTRLGLGLLTAVLVAAATPGRAEDNKGDEGFVSIFNGKDITGWVYKSAPKESLEGRTETPDGRFVVRDGAIVCNEKDNTGKGGIKDLYTVKSYDSDFIFRAEFRAAPRADSGVYIRGPQLQVRDYPTVGPYKPKGFKAGNWNLLEIHVMGGVVTTTVNGKAVTENDVLELTVKNGKPTAKLNGKSVEVSMISVGVGAAAECKCNGEILEKAFKVPSKGGIGLQAETGKFEYRNVRVKELK